MHPIKEKTPSLNFQRWDCHTNKCLAGFGALGFCLLTIGGILAGTTFGAAFYDAASATAASTICSFAVAWHFARKEQKLVIPAAIEKVHEKFKERGIKSPNNGVCGREEITRLDDQLGELRKTKSQRLYQEQFINKFSEAMVSNELALKLRVGQCTELSHSGLIDLMEIFSINTRIEIFHFGETGDHVFLVIGRDPKSIDSDPTTWGEDAWVYDPWLSKQDRRPVYYPANQISDKLMNFLGFINTENGRPDLEPFDPYVHILSPIVGNLIRSEEFAYVLDGVGIHDKDYLALYHDLVCLEKEERWENKVAIAKRMEKRACNVMRLYMNMQPKLLDENVHQVSLLLSQLRHFLTRPGSQPTDLTEIV